MNPLLIRRRGMMQAKSTLPDGQLEWIESDGEEYIDTLIPCVDGLILEIDFMYTSYYSTYNYMAGSGKGSSNRIYFTRKSTSDNKFRMTYNNSGDTTYYGMNAGTRRFIRSEAIKGAQRLYVNGTLRYSTSINTTVNAFTVWLFAAGYDENGITPRPNGNCAARLWSVKLIRHSDNVTLFEALPWRLNGDVGLYDSVSQMFFGNASGIGAFVGGPNI